MNAPTALNAALLDDLLSSDELSCVLPLAENRPKLATPPTATEQLELRLLLEAIALHHGYDFRDYASASLLRRVRRAVCSEGVRSISGLQERLLHDPSAIQRFIASLSVSITAMFRDPHFYAALRQEVIPLLRRQESIRIWHAGCASGEEVYSMAILLHEEGLYERSRLVGTDLNQMALRRARAGIFPTRSMRNNTFNYQQAGGVADFSSYYTASPQQVTFRRFLCRNLTFFQHNLVSDRPFDEFHLVLCRNVMIYFNPQLQRRVHQRLYQSLAPQGVLGLGTTESMRLGGLAEHYRELAPQTRLFQRLR